MVGFLVVLFGVVVVGSFPATWLLMLFLGNVGVNVGFWGALPAGHPDDVLRRRHRRTQPLREVAGLNRRRPGSGPAAR